MVALAILRVTAGVAPLIAQPSGVQRSNQSTDVPAIPGEWRSDPVALTAPPGSICRYSTSRNAHLVQHCRDAAGDYTTAVIAPPQLQQMLAGRGEDPKAGQIFSGFERAVACLTTLTGKAWRSPQGANEVGAWVLEDGRALVVHEGSDKELQLGTPPEGAVASVHTHSASIASGAGPGDANAAAISGRLVYIVSPQAVRAITPATAGYWHYMMHARHHRNAGQSIPNRNWRRQFGSNPCAGVSVRRADQPVEIVAEISREAEVHSK